MFRALYKTISRNMRYEIINLFALLTVILLLMFLIAYSNEMTNEDFLEFIFMLKYKSPVFIALYTAFAGIILLTFFRFVEVIDIVNIKEIAIRINNKKLLSKMLSLNILIFVSTFIIFLFIACVFSSIFLKYKSLNVLQLLFSIALYIFFFLFLSLCYFVSHVKYKNLAYFIFIGFHLNNIFLIIPEISIPNILLKYNISSGILLILFFTLGSMSLSWLEIRGNNYKQ